MVRMDGAEVRKQRIAEIKKMVYAALFADKEAGYTSLSKITCKIEVETGLHNEKIMDILNLLNKAGSFDIDEKKDKITSIKE
jgi:hypothetical protein